jgi:hypothetical protein
VIDPLLDAWGSRSATHIYVMTPFIGDSAAAVNTTMKELFRRPAEQKPLSDDPPSTAPPPPIGFQWATFHEQSGTLSLSIAASNTLPTAWSIWIPGHDAPVFDNVRDTLDLKDDVFAIALDEAARAHRITCIHDPMDG